MNHDCSHDHDHSSHDHAHGANERRTFWAAILISGFMLAEVAGGLWTGSLALVADAGHMLTDAASLSLAWVAFRVARRPATAVHTYGWGRMQVLAGYTNAIALLFLILWIGIEAFHRLTVPSPVLGGPMLAIAALGLLVNVLVFWILHGAERDNPNIRGAMLHVLGDLLGSVAALAAAGLILAFGWMWADPVLSLLVCLLLLRSCVYLIRHSAHILLEGTPAGLDVKKLQKALPAAIEEIVETHHIHAWEVSHKQTAVTLHALLAKGANIDTARMKVQNYLKEKHHIEHVTVQLEREMCDEKTCF